MTVVLTNDDGIWAEGLQELHGALVRAGLEVVVLAPSANQSGVGRAATFRNPVRVRRERRAPGLQFSVQGTPVDCVRAAIVGGVVKGASLVVSGINHGSNLGDDMHNSGTVGAAVEAALLGIPGISISQQAHPGHFHILDAIDEFAVVFNTSAAVGAAFAMAMPEVDCPPRAYLNINVPAGDFPHSVAVTRPGARTYEAGSLAPLATTRDAEYFLLFGAPEDPAPAYDNSPGTDFAAVLAGSVAASPLSVAAPPPDQRMLEAWAEQVCGTAMKHLSDFRGDHR